MKLASCKSALNPPVVCSTDRSKAVVPVLVLLFVALWFILRGDLLYVFPCVILFLCFSVLLVLRLPRLGKRELILVLFVRLFGLCLFRFVGFFFLLGSGKGCGLWLWHSLDFLLPFFLEDLQTDRTNIYILHFYHYGRWERGFGSRKASLSSPSPPPSPPPNTHTYTRARVRPPPPSNSLLTVPRRYFHCGTFCSMLCSVSLSNVLLSTSMYV